MLTRRSALAMMAAAPMAAPEAVPASESGDGGGDFNDPRQNLRALQKILASTDPAQAVISWGAGRVYACVMGKSPVPLFGTHSVSVGRAEGKPDGSFRLRQHIIGFRTAFDQEQPIERMVNPITGAQVDLPFTDYGIGDMDYGHAGTFAHPPGRDPVRISALGPRAWSVTGGVLALSDDALATAPGIAQPKVDAVTRFARVAEIQDGSKPSAESWFGFSAVDPFRPWLQMTEPGFQLWHVNGRKVRHRDDLPAYIKRFVAAQFPKFWDLPVFERG